MNEWIKACSSSRSCVSHESYDPQRRQPGTHRVGATRQSDGYSGSHHHPGTLGIRTNVAALTGQTGDDCRALRLFRALLPDLERMLGPDHPDAVTTRNNIAALTGQ